jgi:hypothetical protein
MRQNDEHDVRVKMRGKERSREQHGRTGMPMLLPIEYVEKISLAN